MEQDMAEGIGLPEWFKEPRKGSCPVAKRPRRQGFLDKTLENIESFMKDALAMNEASANRAGLLQAIDARPRIAGVFMLIFASAIAKGPAFLVAMMLITLVGAALSGVSFERLAKRAVMPVAFTAILVLPVIFSAFTPGQELVNLTGGRLPISITVEGVATGAFFLLRVCVMASFSALILLTTTHVELFKGLNGLPVPNFFVTALFMTFRYIFILIRLLEDTSLARKSRVVGGRGLKEAHAWFASRMSLMLARSLHTAEEVERAMASRGFSGRVRTFKGSPVGPAGYAWLCFTIFVLILSFRM
jgi:cobalt/nickel transport system permease protein